MDKKTILLIVVLAIITIFWAPIMGWLGVYAPPQPKPETQKATTEQVATDTTSSESSQQTSSDTAQKPQPAPVKTAQTATTKADTTQIAAADSLTPAMNTPVDTIIVETKHTRVTLSTFGGGPISIQLKKYKYPWGEKELVEMLPASDAVEPQIVFNSGSMNISQLNYNVDRTGEVDATTSEQTVTFTYSRNDGATIQRIYTFRPDEYAFEVRTFIPNRSRFGIEGSYRLAWNTPLSATELNEADDYNNSFAMGMLTTGSSTYGKDGFFGGDWDGDNYSVEEVADVTWMGMRSKYFATALVPERKTGNRLFVTGHKTKVKSHNNDNITKKTLNVAMELPIEPVNDALDDSVLVYAGPLDWDRMTDYDVDLEAIFDIGTTPFVGWIIRLFAIPIIWLLPKMYVVIPNYGFVIILLGLLIKFATWPLSRKTVRSMAAMKELQPKMEKLKQKHKDNPQAQQQAMMKLFKEAGVNPLSSCMPMLAQMPLFFALFRVFNSTILLRGAPFMLWWNDLSRGATGFTDPYMILVVVMVVLMFLQQKVSMTDPRNKAMVYFMPLLFGFMFYRFSAGLVLYWSTFSAFSFAEQLWGNRQRERENAQVA